jgi:serine/threonine-protein kinase HipA
MRIAVEALSDAELMLLPSATRTGNLDFRPAPDAPEPVLGPPDFAELATLLAAAERIQAGETLTDPLLASLLIQGSSLGGARPKCTVRWQGVLWIAKFPARNEDYNVPRVEYATLRLAARCGIRIPEVRLETIGGRDVLLVRRFDRQPTVSGDARIGYLSALSLMQRDESERFGYPDIADRMRQQGMAGSENQAELFRRMVFNLLVRNTDDHARNHGFLFDGRRLHLSPAFDLVPTPARPGIGTEFNLALELGAQGRHASVDNALSRAAHFGLERPAAIQTMQEVAREVAGWRERFAADRVDEATLERLHHSFTERFIEQIALL